MNRTLWAVMAVCLGIVSVGCDSGETPEAAVVSANPAAKSSTAGHPAARTVHDFLDAIRTGDAQRSRGLLTPLAQQKIKENEMIFAPPASENATFTLGKAEMFDQDKTSVDSQWKDIDVDGKTTTEYMTWALKLEGGQWRISGVIAHMGATQPPVVLNFEDPSQLVGGSPKTKPDPSSQPAQQPMATSPRHATQPTQPTQDPFRR